MFLHITKIRLIAALIVFLSLFAFLLNCGKPADDIKKDDGDAEMKFCAFQSADEDYVDFGQIGAFMNSGSWSIIERVKLPSDASVYGWHMFRGKAWADQDGDVAIELNSGRIYAWVGKSGWNSLLHTGTFDKDRWYDICVLHDAPNSTLYLYVDGIQRDAIGCEPVDDSGNTNRLFFGGQDVDISYSQGDLYSESDIVIAHQAWFQRLLSDSEIQNYAGSHFSGSGLFFETQIVSGNINDGSGHGRNGVNGNSPAYESLWTMVFFDNFNRPDADDANLGHASTGTWNAWAAGGSAGIVSYGMQCSGDDSQDIDHESGAECLKFVPADSVKIRIKFRTPDDVESNFAEFNYIMLKDASGTCPVVLAVSGHEDQSGYILQFVDMNALSELAFSGNLGLKNSTDYLLEFTEEAGIYKGAITGIIGNPLGEISYTGTAYNFEKPGFAVSYYPSGHYFSVDHFGVSVK